MAYRKKLNKNKVDATGHALYVYDQHSGFRVPSTKAVQDPDGYWTHIKDVDLDHPADEMIPVAVSHQLPFTRSEAPDYFVPGALVEVDYTPDVWVYMEDTWITWSIPWGDDN